MNVKRLMTVLGAFLLLYAVIVVIVFAYMQSYDESNISLVNDWKVTLNGEEVEDINGNFKNLKKVVEFHDDDVIEYETVLQDVGDLEFPSLLLKERYCAYEVYFNDELIAERFFEVYERKEHVGLEQRIISLPKDYAGGVVKLRFYVTTSSYITGLDSVWLGSGEDVERAFTHLFAIGYQTGFFMILFGAIYLFLSFLLSPKFSYMSRYIPMGFMCVELGLMLFNRYNLGYLIQNHMFSNRLYEATLFALIPLGMWSGKSILGRSRQYIVSTIETLLTIVGFAMLILNCFWVIRLSHWKNIYLVAVLLMFGLLFYRVYYFFAKENGNIENNIMMVALVVCSACMLIAYTFSGFYYVGIFDLGKRGNLIGLGLMCVGPMFFAYFLLMDFLFNISKVYAKTQEYDSLTRLAYQDGLTHIPNRARARQYLDNLDNKKSGYCIISMDVNGLKEINDSFGHGCGDKLLTTFASILEKVYENDFYARIGGDEFLVVIQDAKENEVKDSLFDLQTEIETQNELGDDPFVYSVSVGYAFSNERTEQAHHEIYLLADERMYANKQEHHKNIKYRR